MFRRAVCLFLFCLSCCGLNAQPDWFEKAFPKSKRMAQDASKAASPVKIVYDANVICVGSAAHLSVDHSLYGPGSDLSFEWFQIGEDGETSLDKGESLVFNSYVEQESCIIVKAMDGSLPIGTDTLWIYTTRMPEYTTVDDTICKGMEATVGVNGGGYWAWSTSGTTSFINIRPAQTTVYRVRVSNYPIVQGGYVNACYAEDSAIVTVNDSAIFTLAGDGEMCAGFDATVRVEGGTDVYWNGTPGGISHSVTVLRDTVVNVTATDRFGCRGVKKWPLTVVENPKGEIYAYVDGELSDTVCLGSAIRIEVESEMECRYRWFNRDTTPFVEIYPQADFTAYCDISVGGSLAGTVCKARLETFVTVKNCHHVYFASGFVLDGYNKTFGPIGVEDTTRTYEFRIFNHNGTQVFQTTRFTEGWDGRYKGQWVQPGVYVYVYREKYRQLTWERKGTFAVIK
ncbi:MAG: gliding motility-associated C-terminal domain-containing protein [Bacteroides sp.]|nr:gliding motility-associated C-terminal domain-containing protein [Bacteroides sp.]MCM1085754.1 gliding motility-associated C-terminal domain-containing protein [Bacteroides sp.]